VVGCIGSFLGSNTKWLPPPPYAACCGEHFVTRQKIRLPSLAKLGVPLGISRPFDSASVVQSHNAKGLAGRQVESPLCYVCCSGVNRTLMLQCGNFGL
jgi:hypothetical protein